MYLAHLHKHFHIGGLCGWFVWLLVCFNFLTPKKPKQANSILPSFKNKNSAIHSATESSNHKNMEQIKFLNYDRVKLNMAWFSTSSEINLLRKFKR